jgi:hypothetical protein
MKFFPPCRVLHKALHFLNIWLLFFLFYPYLLHASVHTYTILDQSDKYLKIKFTIAKPDFIKEGNAVYSTYKKAAYIIDNNGARVPVFNELLNFPGKNAQIRIVSQTEENIPVENYLLVEADPQAGNAASIKYLGVYRNLPLYSLSVKPVKYNIGTKTISWTKEIVIEVIAGSEAPKTISHKGVSKMEPSLKKSLLSGSRLYTADNSYSITQTKMTHSDILLNSTVFKIKVNEDGLYKVTYNDLAAASFPFSTVNFRNMALYVKNVEIPIYINGFKDGSFDPGDSFEFWGERNARTFLDQYADVYSDPFSDDNVYWLAEKSSAGLRYAEENAAILETNPANYLRPTRFRDKIHFEQNTHWERFGHDPENIDKPAHTYDHWFWGGVISAVSSRSFDFQIAHPFDQGGASVFLEAMFRGVSIYNYRTNPIQGHKVALWLNNTKVNEVLPGEEWQGQKKRLIKNDAGLDATALQNGDNTLRVVMDQEGLTDIVLLNWFDVSYLRKYRADKGFIKFRVQENLLADPRVKHFEVDGFNNSSIEIYKLGISKILGTRTDFFEDNNGYRSYRVTFQDHVFDTEVEYIALHESAKKKPISITPYLPWKSDQPNLLLTNSSNNADLIIIRPTFFENQVNRLKALKEELGYTTEVVTVDQIYDTFNFGIKSPLAIHEFLKYAYFSWNQSNKLKYVIFAGDAAFSSRVSSDIIPAILFSTNTFGAAPSDLLYALLDGDDMIPDIHIGRIPASNVQELTSYIDKVESYQNITTHSSWKSKALFISGNDGSGSDLEFLTNKPIFRAQNARLISLKLPEDIMAYKLNTIANESIPSSPDDPDFGSTRELTDYLDDGVSFVNFFGHGGGAIWADRVLFDLDNVENLRNEGKYPFVASMTCFTGAFENPNRLGLSEKLLLADKKGAIATLASSSVGWKYNDFAIEWALPDYLWDDNYTFGEAVDLMKISYMANSQYYTESGTISTPGWRNQGNSPLWSSMVNQYNFLGDPTLKMAKPAQNLDIKISDKTPGAGEQLQITINAPQDIPVGAGVIEISNQHNVKYLTQNFALSTGIYTQSFNIPDSIAGSNLRIKAYVSNGQTDAAGHTVVSVERSAVSSVKVLPENPDITDPLTFQVIAHSHSPIAHMELRSFRNEDGTGNSQLLVIMDPQNDSLFVSRNALAWSLKGGVSYFEIYIRDEAGNESRYDLQRMVINDNRPDLEIDFNSVKYSGNDRLFISANVRNNSTTTADSVRIQCFEGQQEQPFYNSLFDFQSWQNRVINIPYDMDTLVQTKNFIIYVDPLHAINEKSENNNSVNKILTTDHVFVDRQTGTTINGSMHSAIPVLENWSLSIAPNVLNASSVIAFEKVNIMDLIQSNTQKDLKFISTGYVSDSSAIRISVNNSITNLIATLYAKMDTAVYAQTELVNASFYQFNNYLGLWSKIESDFSNGNVTASINQNGMYAVFAGTDEIVPQIEVTANGRTLSQVNVNNVGVKPSISILLQDENGIDFSNTFSVAINGSPLNSENLIIPDSITNPKSIAVIINPELEKGMHTLEITAADMNRNTAIVNIPFQAVNSEEFKVYGNYPNPFNDFTIISYDNFSDDLFDLKTRIYSVSGRLIRKKALPPPEGIADDLLATGYHELQWDGIDDDGNEVANGVYFVVVEALYRDNSGKKTTVKRKLKVARLQ